MIDLHCDTIYALWVNRSSLSLLSNDLSVDVTKLKEGGVKGQCFALFVPMHQDNQWYGSLRPWEIVNALHDRFLCELEKAKGELTAYRSVSQFEQEKGPFAILTVEEGGAIEGDVTRIHTLATWGVKIMSLTWNYRNELASPNSLDPKVMSQGLTEKGFEALEALQSEGIICDISHLSDGGVRDVLFSSKVPVLASHSNAREVIDVPRNLPDDLIKALADRGGVMGLNFCPSFLHVYPEGTEKKDHFSLIADMVRNIQHVYAVGGEDILAMGTDFDGIGGTLEIPSSSAMPRLHDALLKGGIPAHVLDKMWEGNALRVLKEAELRRGEALAK